MFLCFFATAVLLGQSFVLLRPTAPGSKFTGVTNGQLETENLSYSTLFSNFQVNDVGFAYPRAQYVSGPDAELLRSMYRVEVEGDPALLAEHLLQNAVGIYDRISHYIETDTIDAEVVNSLTTTDPTICYPDDPVYDETGWWHMEMHDIPELFCNQPTVNSDIKIGIFDLSYKNVYTYPDVADAIVGIEAGQTASLYGPNANVHGTLTVKTLFSTINNGIDGAGTASGAKGILFRTGGTAVDHINDMLEARERGVSMIVSTIHVFHNTAQSSLDDIQAALNILEESGIVVLYPASNGNTNGKLGGVNLAVYRPDPSAWGPPRNGYSNPASLDNCISVSSVTQDLCVFSSWRSCFANLDLCRYTGVQGYMTQNDRVDVIGPGWCVPNGHIFPECVDDNRVVKSLPAIQSGNSVATPFIGGIVAHMLTVNPCLGHDEILKIFQMSETGTEWLNACPENLLVYSEADHPPLPSAPLAVSIAEDYGKYTITQPTTWTEDKFVTELNIEAGGDLIIEGAEITLASRSRIKVKRGGRLRALNTVFNGRSCSNTDKLWPGIQVHGNINLPQPDAYATLSNPDQAGILILQNGTVLKDVQHTAIRNYNNQNWNEENGGLIIADGCYFEGIVRTAEFLKYASGASNFTDNSSFTNCIFTASEDQSINNGLAVSIWRTDGVTFEGNIFDGFENSAITAMDAEVFVLNENQFLNNSTGVKLLASNGVSSSGEVVNNYFNENTYALDFTSSGLRGEVAVVNNQFFKNGHGLSVAGAAAIDVYDNSFDLNTFDGIQVLNTNLWLSDIQNNSFIELENGVQFYNNCSGTEFTRNCFNGVTQPDVTIEKISPLVLQSAMVKPTQGFGDFPANNCFTNDGIDIKADADQVEMFEYFVRPGLTTNNCLVPSSNLTSGGTYQANYILQVSTQLGENPCYDGFLIPSDTIIVANNQRIKGYYDNYVLARMAHEQQPTTSTADSLTYFQSLYTRALLYRIQQAEQTQNLVPLENLLIYLDNGQATEWLIDAAVHVEDSTKAMNYLGQYITKYGENSFSRTRKVSIELLGYDDKYSLSSIASQELSSIYSDNSDPHRGVAGSILDFLGIIQYSFPDLENSSSGNGAAFGSVESPVNTQRSNLANVRIAPNPLTNVLNIYLPVDWEVKEDLLLHLYDHSGRLCKSKTMSEVWSTSIQLKDFPKGIYYLQIANENGVEIRKIVKQ